MKCSSQSSHYPVLPSVVQRRESNAKTVVWNDSPASVTYAHSVTISSHRDDPAASPGGPPGGGGVGTVEAELTDGVVRLLSTSQTSGTRRSPNRDGPAVGGGATSAGTSHSRGKHLTCLQEGGIIESYKLTPPRSLLSTPQTPLSLVLALAPRGLVCAHLRLHLHHPKI